MSAPDNICKIKRTDIFIDGIVPIHTGKEKELISKFILLVISLQHTKLISALEKKRSQGGFPHEERR